jgi:hypothetical protein
MTTYFKINDKDYSKYVAGLKVGNEVLVSNNSGRNANGDTVIDVINRKYKVYVNFIPMYDTEMKALLASVEDYVVDISFRNPKTNALTTITTYIGTPEPEYYTIQNNKVLYKPLALNFIEL